MTLEEILKTIPDGVQLFKSCKGEYLAGIGKNERYVFSRWHDAPADAIMEALKRKQKFNL